MVSKERIKAKIQHVLDAVKAIQELEANVALCLADNIEGTEHDPAGIVDDATKGRNLLYQHLRELLTMLLDAEEAECISVRDPKSDKERDILKLVAEILIGNGAGEEGKRFEKGKEEVGLLGKCSNWALGRAAACGREVTAFCDLWLGITSVLLVVTLVKKYTAVDIGKLAEDAMNKKKGPSS